MRAHGMSVARISLEPLQIKSRSMSSMSSSALTNNGIALRFFVTKNSDMETNFRQPPDWRKFGFIDVEAVEQYEDNWDLLKT